MKKYSKIKEISCADIKNNILKYGLLAMLENGCLMVICSNKKNPYKIGDLLCYYDDNIDNEVEIIYDGIEIIDDEI